MKNYLILAMLLIAGMTAYPQATRSRENKSEKSSAKKENVQRSATRSAGNSSSDKKAAAASQQRSRSEARSASNQKTQSAASRSGENRSGTTRSAATKSGENRSVGTRGTETRSAATRSSNSRSEAVRSTDRTQNNRSSVDDARKAQDARRVQSTTNQRNQSSSATRDQNSAVRNDNRSGSGVTSNRNDRGSDNNFDRDVKVGNSASRIYREGKGTMTRDDGKVYRHQNDEVFSSNRYNLHYDNYEHLRRSDDFRRDYNDYYNWYHHRNIRVINHYHTNYIPLSIEIRRARYYHRYPRHIDLIWTPLLFHRFMYYYPTHTNWEMEFGSAIETISAYDAEAYAGTVRRVYGKVADVYYSPEDENYILYIGSPFPYQDMSIVIPRNIARNISMSPKWYFDNEYIWVVGLINMWDGKPEVIVRDEDQIRKY